jgi:hypothetical protein
MRLAVRGRGRISESILFNVLVVDAAGVVGAPPITVRELEALVVAGLHQHVLKDGGEPVAELRVIALDLKVESLVDGRLKVSDGVGTAHASSSHESIKTSLERFVKRSTREGEAHAKLLAEGPEIGVGLLVPGAARALGLRLLPARGRGKAPLREDGPVGLRREVRDGRRVTVEHDALREALGADGAALGLRASGKGGENLCVGHKRIEPGP